MTQAQFTNVPLLGALCVAAGLVSQADLERCLKLQQTLYQGTPIGQILVLKGYLSQVDLARMVAKQQSFRRVLCSTLERQIDAVANTPVPDSAGPATALPTPTETHDITASDLAEQATPIY